jgi:hypothetical protein
MPLLADRLLNAGAEDDALIEHCRGGGEHEGLLGRRLGARQVVRY